jgi:cellobiose-specific phosphotransferase system component IIC
MLQLVQDGMIILFGLVLIGILLIILVKVHKQMQKVKELESQVRLNEKAKTAEIIANQEETING